MVEKNKLGLFIGYYLSKFNTEAYDALGYGNMAQTHERLGQIMGIKANTIKNWRDEFDPLHDHRAGWHQVSLTRTRINVVQAMEDLSEEDIRQIVQDILSNTLDKVEEANLVSIVDEIDSQPEVSFLLRGPTGRKAEEFFISYYAEHKDPIEGKLKDARDFGVGYDFEIATCHGPVYIEIKGLAEITGGVLFTNKEWKVAQMQQDNFFLGIVSGVKTNPKIDFIRNPFKRLKARKSIVRPIQINWSICASDINHAIQND